MTFLGPSSVRQRRPNSNNKLREGADSDGFVEPLLWTDIGKARLGAGGALVGSADQIVEKINRYMGMGMRAFIFSGYPLLEESEYVARLVLPRLPNASMPVVQGRIEKGGYGSCEEPRINYG